MPGTDLAASIVEAWLSAPRFGVYLSRSGNDSTRALNLYQWNAQVASALLHDIGHLEVLVRNRYDPRLLSHYPDWTDPSSALWTLETGYTQTRASQRDSNRLSVKAITKARRGASTHGHVVANLSFGFWTALTQSERDATIWTPTLSGAYPGMTRGQVHNNMRKLNVFRNRLAHWEPVFTRTTGLMRQLNLMDDMFLALDVDVRNWVGANSKVPAVVAQMPETVLTPWTGSYLGSSV
jgi:hypothetical protein